MRIEQALFTYLSTAVPLVTSRIYPVEAPQGASTPYIVYSKVSNQRSYSHSGAGKMCKPRFQFSIYSTAYFDGKAIAEQLQTALEAYTGTMGGTTGTRVQGTFYVNELDMADNAVEGFNADDLHCVVCDYFIQHYE
jgi:hypothetical protein